MAKKLVFKQKNALVIIVGYRDYTCFFMHLQFPSPEEVV